MYRSILLRALCAAALLTVSSLAARAQAAVPSPSPSSVPQIAHVVTSDRSSETPASAARTTYVVTQKQIAEHGYTTVAQAIATVPGVYLTSYGPGAALAQAQIRGSTSSQVLVLIDGAPAAGAQLDSVDLNSIQTIGVERIEVVEGGGSTLYGSGSMGGIINIITSSHKGTDADVTIGSFGRQDVRIQTPNLSFQRSVGIENFSLPGAPTLSDADYGVTAGRVSFARTLGGVRARFAAGITARDLGSNGGDRFFSPTSRQDDVTRDAHLTLDRTSGAATTTLQLDASSYTLAVNCNTPIDPTCFNSYITPAMPYSELDTEGRVEAGLRTVVDTGHGSTIYGIDLSRGVASINDGLGDPIETRPFDQVAAYVQQRWLLHGGNVFYAGLRGETDGSAGGAYSPSIGAIVRVANHIDVRANAATAFRAPSVDELYYPNFSNPNLVSEKTRVDDLTVNDDAILGGAELGFFSTSGNNLIVDDATYTPQNIGHASIRGATFTLATKPLDGFTATLGATDLYRAQDLDAVAGGDVNAGQRIPGRGPVLQANLDIEYAGSGTLQSAGISDRDQGIRSAIGTASPAFDQAIAYSTVDAFARFRVGSHGLLTLRCYNLGDARYAIVTGYPMPGRSFALELSTR